MVLVHTPSRRAWIFTAAGLWNRGFGAKDFWDTKDPADWSNEEIRKLLTKSPWARQVTATRVAANHPATRPRRNGMPPVEQPPRVTTAYTAEVVWESAGPIRLATNETLDPAFEVMYVLSLGGVPAGNSKNAPEKIRAATTLHVKGREAVPPSLARRVSGGRGVILCGFARQGMEISRDDKEVVFSTAVNRIAVSAKFNPREMVYRGELAL